MAFPRQLRGPYPLLQGAVLHTNMRRKRQVSVTPKQFTAHLPSGVRYSAPLLNVTKFLLRRRVLRGRRRLLGLRWDAGTLLDVPTPGTPSGFALHPPGSLPAFFPGTSPCEAPGRQGALFPPLPAGRGRRGGAKREGGAWPVQLAPPSRPEALQQGRRRCEVTASW